jgi:single-stranded-DNA-specific exonuclease
VGSLAEEDGIIVGSARMPEGRGLNALDAMGFASEALDQFGGHAVAAGFELKEKNASLFAAKLEEFFAKKAISVEPRTWLYDAEASLNDLNPNFMTWYEHMSPFGAQFTPPVFCVKNVRLQQVRPLKGGHFRLTLAEPDQNSALTSRVALWFAPPKTHPLAAIDQEDVGRVDVLVEPQWNYFSGKKTLQLLVQDIRTARTSS